MNRYLRMLTGILFSSKQRFAYLSKAGFYDWLADDRYLKLKARRMGGGA